VGERGAGRAERRLGLEGLTDRLADDLSGSELTSLLLAVTRRRSRRVTPAQLLAAAGRDATVPPSDVDARLLHRITGAFLDAATGFEAVELAPVSPVGLNTALGGIDQNNALATVRGTEVLADPTAAHALVAAQRRRAGAGEVRLCSSERLLRLQPFDGDLWRQHFRIGALTTAGPAEPDHGFELRALREHAELHLRFLAKLDPGGDRLGRRTVLVADTDPEAGRVARLEAAVLEPLRSEFPDADVAFTAERAHAMGYYDRLALEIRLAPEEREPVSIADGGSVDWLSRLLANRRERAFTSGIGIETLARLITPAPPPP
jgi:hypothetical protein